MTRLYCGARVHLRRQYRRVGVMAENQEHVVATQLEILTK